MPQIRAEQIQNETMTNLQIAINAAISQSKIASQSQDPTGWITKGTVQVVAEMPTFDGSQKGQIFYIDGTGELYVGTEVSPFYQALGGAGGWESQVTILDGSEGDDWNGNSATRFTSDNDFNLDGSNLFVYLNGIMLQYDGGGNGDYVIVDKNTIQINNLIAATSGEKVTMLVYAGATLNNYATKNYVDEKLSGSIDLSGDTEVAGNLSPATPDIYNLGSETDTWANLYLNDSLYFKPIGTGDNLRIYRNKVGEDSQMKFQIGNSATDKIIFEDENNTVIMAIDGDGGVTIPGDLTVQGTTIYQDETNSQVSDADFIIKEAGVPFDGDASFQVERASGNAQLKWNDAIDRWQVIYGVTGNITSNVLTEDDLASGIDLDSRYVKEDQLLDTSQDAVGAVKFVGDTATPAEGVFYSGDVAPDGTQRLNYNGDLYVHDLHTNKNSIYIGGARLSYDNDNNRLQFKDSANEITLGDTKGIKGQRLLIFYGTPQGINGAWDDDKAAQEMSNYDHIVIGDGLQEITHTYYDSTTAIVAKLKKINPDVKIYGYVNIGVSTSNYGLGALQTKMDEWETVGVTDIFVDECGYDYQVSRTRMNDVIDYVHGKKMNAFLNGWNPDDIFSLDVDATYNPAGTASTAIEGDLYLCESFIVNTETYTGNSGYDTQFNIKTKADQVIGYAQNLGIRPMAIGMVNSTTDQEVVEDYWSTYESFCQIFGMYGYGLATESYSSINDLTVNVEYDTEYTPFYTTEVEYELDGNWELFTRSQGGKTVNAYAKDATEWWGDIGQVMRVQRHKSDGFYYGDVDPDGTKRINYNGDFYATRVYNAIWNDLAEFMPKAEESKAGMVLVMTEDGVAPCKKRADRAVVGTHSDTFGYALGAEDKENKTPVGLSGRSWAWIEEPVAIGDMLVSSDNPGYASKATDEELLIPGIKFGKVLKTKSDSTPERIEILILNA